MSELPPGLAAHLHAWHDAADTRLWVAALEAHGVAVAVVRLQLGSTKTEGYGTTREVYRTPQKKGEEPNA